MAALARAGAFQSNWQRQPLTGFPQGSRIRLPGIAVEVDGQPITRFIREHGIHAHDEFTAQIIPAGQVMADYVVGDPQEASIWTFEAFYAGLLAQTADPFVRASRLVAGAAGLAALESTRIHILASTE